MSGYLNNDGSELIGANNPSNVGQSLKLDALGNLLVSLEDPSLAQITSGAAWLGTTGQMTLANATSDAPMSLFNPSNSGKSALITSLVVSAGTGSIVGILFATTTDPAPTYTSALLVNNANPSIANSGATKSVLSSSFISTSQSEPGSGEFRRLYNQYFQEMIPNGYGLLLPKGSAHGVSTFMETYAPGGIGSVSATWFEN